MHQLQEVFATAEGERAFEERLHALFAASDFDAVETILSEHIATMDSPVAELCRQLDHDAIEINGLEDVFDCVDGLEGEPVSTVIIVAANPPDLAFEKGKTHEPFLAAMLYTDEDYAFSGTPADQIIAECGNEEGPAWAGKEEDIELYLEIEGFGPLNTALLFHKQRHFFRDDNPPQAPLRYVEYVVGCWWRALRCQQAIAARVKEHLHPIGIGAVVAVEDMRPELISVLAKPAMEQVAERRPVVELASIEAETFIQRKVVEEEKEFSGADLRRKVDEIMEEAPEPEPKKRGFFSRLFGRGRSVDKAA